MPVMTMLLSGIVAVGGVVAFIGAVWFLVVAFKEHILWGLGSLLLPIVGLVFLIMHWRKAWIPFVIQLVGGLIAAGAVAAQAVFFVRNQAAFPGIEMPIPSALPVAPGEDAPGVSAEPALPQVGESLADVRARFGSPSGEIKSGNGVTLLYPGFNVTSDDGTVVSEVDVRAPAPEPTRETGRPSNASAGPQPEVIRKISKGGAEVALGSLLVPGKITIVDFYADWCGPCRAISPHLEEMARDNKDVVLRKVDIVKWGTPVTRQYQINSVPNIHVFDRSGRRIAGPTHNPEVVRRAIAQAR